MTEHEIKSLTQRTGLVHTQHAADGDEFANRFQQKPPFDVEPVDEAEHTHPPALERVAKRDQDSHGGVVQEFQRRTDSGTKPDEAEEPDARGQNAAGRRGHEARWEAPQRYHRCPRQCTRIGVPPPAVGPGRLGAMLRTARDPEHRVLRPTCSAPTVDDQVIMADRLAYHPGVLGWRSPS